MGVIVNKENDKNNELSRRIDADLRAKLDGKQKTEDVDKDFVESQEYISDLKKTGEYGWVWVVLIIIIVIVAILIGTSTKTGN